MPIRVFIIDDNGKKCCVNTTTDFDAEIWIEQGGVELAPAVIAEIFGDKAGLVSPETTSIDEEGNIHFTPPDFTDMNKDMVRNERDGLLSLYDRQIDILNRKIRFADTIDEQRALNELVTQWDEYAKALCALPEQEGFPWDGGGPLTPWPKQPTIVKGG